jgi:hypothetical protein
MSPSPVAINTAFEKYSGWVLNKSRAITVPIEPINLIFSSFKWSIRLITSFAKFVVP